jgi:chemotaxis protein methyltransferase CheR
MEISEEIYGQIRRLVYSASRINLGPDKKQLVTTRLTKRISQLGMNNFDQYWSYVISPAGRPETGIIIDSLTTNYTKFFREPKTLDFLAKRILPEWDKSRTDPFSIWCCASSTGEEPYTLSIILSEFFGEENRHRWKLIASDISDRVLQTAQTGIYEASKLQLPDSRWVSRYFQRGTGAQAGKTRVKASLRNNITFLNINLFQANYPFDFKFDVIFCRNVMIYFDRNCQKELVNKLLTFLKPGGYLMVGSSESITGVTNNLRAIEPTAYKKEKV